MRWRLILKYFGPNIQHIAVVDNIVAGVLSRLPCTPVNKYNPSTFQFQCHTNKLLTPGRDKNNKYCFLLDLLNLQREQKKGLININYKLSAYLTDKRYVYSNQTLDYVELI